MSPKGTGWGQVFVPIYSRQCARNAPERLIIVDPSLKDYVGHHAEYDRAVAAAAQGEGIATTVLAHRQAKGDVAGVPLQPVFSNDMWGNAPVATGRALAVAVWLFQCAQFPFWLTATAYGMSATIRDRARRRRIGAAQQGYGVGTDAAAGKIAQTLPAERQSPYSPPGTRTLSIPDRVIRSWRKHGTVHVIRTALAVTGRSATRAIGRIPVGCLRPLLRVPMLTASVTRGYLALAVERIRVPWVLALLFISNPRYFFEADRGIRANVRQGTTLVYLHMIFFGNLLESVLLAIRYGRKSKVPVVLMFRYPPSLCRPARLQTRLAFRLLEQAVENGMVRAATDSRRLADEYASHTWAPMEVFPIPHGSAIEAQGRAGSTAGMTRIRIASLGNARAEKGILEIIEAAEILESSSIASQIEFVLQVNDPSDDCRVAVRRLQHAHCPTNVTLITDSMDTSSYASLLRSADVVLVPYWREVYTSRTSGILLEAVTAGKPVIVTSDTWMSDEMERWGAGITVADHSAAALAAGIGRLVRDYRRFAQDASRAAPESRKFHSPESFLRHLFGQRRTRFCTERRALVSYPWGNLFLRDSGASLRATLLVDFLQSNGYAVTAHCTSEAEMAAAPPKVTCLLYRGASSSFREPRFLAATVLRMLLAPWRSEARDLWFRFESWCRERPFRLLMNRALYDCSAVFLKYPFLAGVFHPLCRGHGIPLAVADYDVLSLQVHNSLARRAMLRVETDGLRAADLAACVSDADRAVFKQEGCDTLVIPNPIDMDAHPIRGDFESQRILEQHGLVLPPLFCLFVGSYHPPNLGAAHQLAALAARPALKSAGVNFVTAGRCRIEGVESSGLIQLGPVNRDVLVALYALAAYVVVPLHEGTGTSLKVVEAMAYGKVVIGTPIAFRGLPVCDGENAIVAASADAIAEAIVRLRADPSKLDELSRGARKFAARYDFRSAFGPYLDFLSASRSPPIQPSRET